MMIISTVLQTSAQNKNNVCSTLNSTSVEASNFSSVCHEHTNALPCYKCKVAWLLRVGKANANEI